MIRHIGTMIRQQRYPTSISRPIMVGVCSVICFGVQARSTLAQSSVSSTTTTTNNMSHHQSLLNVVDEVKKNNKTLETPNVKTLLPVGYKLFQVTNQNYQVSYTSFVLVPSEEILQLFVSSKWQQNTIFKEVDQIETYSVQEQLNNVVKELDSTFNGALHNVKLRIPTITEDCSLKLWILERALTTDTKTTQLIWASEQDIHVYQKEHHWFIISPFSVDKIHRIEKNQIVEPIITRHKISIEDHRKQIVTLKQKLQFLDHLENHQIV